MKLAGFKWLAFIFSILLTGCVAQKTQPKPSDLIGSWKTDTIDTEWGSAIIEANFSSPTELEFKFIPVNTPNSKPIINQGQYTLSGGLITSSVINKGKPVPIWLEGKILVIQSPDDNPMRLTRK